MSNPIRNFTGVKSGKLTAIKMLPGRGPTGLPMWRCRCDCGRLISVSSFSLARGKNLSCGQKECHTSITTDSVAMGRGIPKTISKKILALKEIGFIVSAECREILGMAKGSFVKISEDPNIDKIILPIPRNNGNGIQNIIMYKKEDILAFAKNKTASLKIKNVSAKKPFQMTCEKDLMNYIQGVEIKFERLSKNVELLQKRMAEICKMVQEDISIYSDEQKNKRRV